MCPQYNVSITDVFLIYTIGLRCRKEIREIHETVRCQHQRGLGVWGEQSSTTPYTMSTVQYISCCWLCGLGVGVVIDYSKWKCVSVVIDYAVSPNINIYKYSKLWRPLTDLKKFRQNSFTLVCLHTNYSLAIIRQLEMGGYIRLKA